MIKKLIPVLILILFFNCKETVKKSETNPTKRGLVTDKAMVVSARKEASKIGTEIMKLGGNAFDAMMATEMALAVTYPYAGNLGGGGFLVYRMADGEVGALDYREKAPLAAIKGMYLDEDGNIIKGKSTLGSLAIGVPGTIAGVFKAQERFGHLDIVTILKPVIELAENGFTITQKQELRFKGYDSLFKVINGKEILFNKNQSAGKK